MKSTYKLLNIYLDGKPLPSTIPKVIDSTKKMEYYDIGDELNIFDFPVCRRKISGMKLLSYQSEKDVIKIISKLPNCNELAIVLDYNSKSGIACKLFLKRILQATCLIMKQYPDIAVVFIGNSTDNEKIEYLYQNQSLRVNSKCYVS